MAGEVYLVQPSPRFSEAGILPGRAWGLHLETSNKPLAFGGVGGSSYSLERKREVPVPAWEELV